MVTYPVLVERLAERGEHLHEVHPAEKAGRDRGHGDDQQRIEAEREAEDDQRDAEQRPVIDHSPLLPKPPPPGVSITKPIAGLHLGRRGRGQHLDRSVGPLDPVAARLRIGAARDPARRHAAAVGEDVGAHRLEEA